MTPTFDAKGWLRADTCRIVPSVRNHIFDVSTGDRPLALVWHLADNARPAVEQANAIRTFKRLADTPVSWNFLVAADGTLYQSVPVSVGSWHTGRPGRVGGRLVGNVDRATLGIRLEQGQTPEQAAAAALLVRLFAVRFKLSRAECAHTSGGFHTPPKDEPWRSFLSDVLQGVFGKEAI